MQLPTDHIYQCTQCGTHATVRTHERMRDREPYIFCLRCDSVRAMERVCERMRFEALLPTTPVMPDKGESRMERKDYTQLQTTDIRERRRALGLSAVAFAKAAGVSLPTVLKVETAPDGAVVRQCKLDAILSTLDRLASDQAQA